MSSHIILSRSCFLIRQGLVSWQKASSSSFQCWSWESCITLICTLLLLLPIHHSHHKPITFLLALIKKFPRSHLEKPAWPELHQLYENFSSIIWIPLFIILKMSHLLAGRNWSSSLIKYKHTQISQMHYTTFFSINCVYNNKY